MSHYVYDPSSGRFKSNAYVTLSLEEMRYEYYEEMEEMKRSETKRKITMAVDENKLRKRIKIAKTELLKIEEPENRRAKRKYESDSEDMLNLKKIKITENSLNRCRSINDELDILSSSIIKSSKKSRINESQKPLKYKLQQSSKSLENEKKLINSIIELRKIGNEMVKIGDYLSAFDRYTESLNLSVGKYPQLTSMNFSNRAFSLMKLDRYAEALQDCDAAILNYSRCDEKTKLRRIKCLIEMEHFHDAKNDVIKLKMESGHNECDKLLAIIIDKQKYSDLIEEGKKMEACENYSQAVLSYSEAIEIDNNSSLLLESRARVLFHLGRYRESLSDLNEALRLNPLNLRPMFNRIGCLMKLERFHEAIRDAEELNKCHPCQENRDLLRNAINAEKVASKRNYYEILKVDRKASLSEITKQYRKMALLFHPDKIVDGDFKAKSQNEEKFKELTLIFKTLSDSVSRKMYDIELTSRL